MLILIGAKTKEVARIPLLLHCPICNSRGSLELYILHKGFTLFYIPAMPVEKIGIVGCHVCQATFVRKEMPPAMLEETGVLMSRHHITWYNYIPGIIVLILTFSAMLFWLTS